MKTFVLTVSKVFPSTHIRKGEETFFPEKIKSVIGNESFAKMFIPKLHTIRANYDLWKNRIEQIQKGEAILSIRFWSEKPYRSKQVEICQLDKDSGIGLQKLEFLNSNIYDPVSEITYLKTSDIAKNDGLSLNDFKEWFKNYDLSKSLAIIHFTPMRY